MFSQKSSKDHLLLIDPMLLQEETSIKFTGPRRLARIISYHSSSVTAGRNITKLILFILDSFIMCSLKVTLTNPHFFQIRTKKPRIFRSWCRTVYHKTICFYSGPIVFGALLDFVCILSETDTCDQNSDRNCLEYRNDHLR